MWWRCWECCSHWLQGPPPGGCFIPPCLPSLTSSLYISESATSRWDQKGQIKIFQTNMNSKYLYWNNILHENFISLKNVCYEIQKQYTSNAERRNHYKKVEYLNIKCYAKRSALISLIMRSYLGYKLSNRTKYFDKSVTDEVVTANTRQCSAILAVNRVIILQLSKRWRG